MRKLKILSADSIEELEIAVNDFVAKASVLIHQIEMPVEYREAQTEGDSSTARFICGLLYSPI